MNCIRIRKTGYEEVQCGWIAGTTIAEGLLSPSSGLQYGYITLKMHGNKVTEHGASVRHSWAHCKKRIWGSIRLKSSTGKSDKAKSVNNRCENMKHQASPFGLCRIYFCLPSNINPHTFNSWEIWFPHLAKILGEPVTKSPFSSFTICTSSRLVTLLKVTDAPIQVSHILIFLLVSRSSISAFRYSFILFLKCLLASRLTLYRLSTVLWFGS
jgi:hypothetical protein